MYLSICIYKYIYICIYIYNNNKKERGTYLPTPRPTTPLRCRRVPAPSSTRGCIHSKWMLNIMIMLHSPCIPHELVGVYIANVHLSSWAVCSVHVYLLLCAHFVHICRPSVHGTKLYAVLRLHGPKLTRRNGRGICSRTPRPTMTMQVCHCAT